MEKAEDTQLLCQLGLIFSHVKYHYFPVLQYSVYIINQPCYALVMTLNRRCGDAGQMLYARLNTLNEIVYKILQLSLKNINK